MGCKLIPIGQLYEKSPKPLGAFRNPAWTAWKKNIGVYIVGFLNFISEVIIIITLLKRKSISASELVTIRDWFGFEKLSDFNYKSGLIHKMDICEHKTGLYSITYTESQV